MIISISKNAIGMAFIALATQLFATEALSLDLERKEFVCPYDGVKFKAVLVLSEYSEGNYLDLKEYGSVMSPWPLASCPTNGFVFLKSGLQDNTYSDDELEKLRSVIFSPEYQALKAEPARRRAAFLFEQEGKPHWDVSQQWLMATWEVSDKPELYNAYATTLIDRLAQDEIDAIDTEKKQTVLALRGELQRRIGRFSDSKKTFSNLIRASDPGSNFVRIARFQMKLLDKRDTNTHKVSEALPN